MTDSLTPPEPKSPAPVAPVVESATPTQRTAAVERAAASAETAASAATSAAQSAAVVAASVPVAVQVLDKLFDGLAILVVGALAWHRIIDGTLGAGLVVFIATGNTGIRALSQRAGGPAVGVAGMALLALLSVVGYAPAVAAAPVAVAVLHRASGGHATRRQMAALLAVSLLGALAVPAVLWLAGGVR